MPEAQFRLRKLACGSGLLGPANMLCRLMALVIISSVGQSQACRADITLVSVNSTVSAQIETNNGFNSQTATSILNSDSISVAVLGARQTQFSESRASSQHDWDGSRLVASSLIEFEKTRNARRGGQHIGQAELVFQFSIDSDYDFFLDGSYGYLTADGSNDSLSWSLVGNGVSLGSAAGQFGSGINGEAFSASGRLQAGTYTLTLDGSFDESMGRADLRQAGWTLNEFRLTAVPEPAVGIWAWVVLSLGAAICRRR